MPDIQNTQVLNITITETTTDPATGVVSVVPLRSTDVFSVTSTRADGSDSSASFAGAVVVGADGVVTVTGTPVVIESDAANGGGGFMLTISDNAGDVAFVSGPWNIITVPVVRSISGGEPTFTSQAAPTNPGP